ncbi:NAD(P)H-quinone oxidoreductase subunit F, partial [Synechococcus sp. H60.1]
MSLDGLVRTAWLIPLYALVAWLGALIWSPGITRRTGPRPAGYLNALLTLVAFLHSVGALVAIWDQPAQVIRLPWLQVGDLVLELPLQASSLTLGACAVVTALNLVAQIYGFGYMEMDWGWARFFSLLGLFEGGMCALALCDSLFFSYVILEILTLGTYLLVGFWFNQSLVVTGARDAFLTKRIGDLLLLMGVIAIYPLTGSWEFEDLTAWAKSVQAGAISVDPTLITLAGLGLLAGPVGKCAQFPLHLWLDEAMEGPIPASILRNSVVVGTGAWVLIRLQPLYALSPTVLRVMLVIGGLTAVGGAFVALAQIDAKRALSYLV